MSTGPLNSSAPTTAVVIGGVYNATTPAPNDKQAMALQVDNEGNLLVDIAAGTITTAPVSSTTSNVPSQQTVTSTSGQILATNSSRKECTVVNTGTVAVYLGLGRTPTSTAYHVALSACTSANDGTGGTYTSDIWKGAINAITASTSGTVVITELT